MRVPNLALIALLAARSTLFAQTTSGSGLDTARIETIRPRLQALVDNRTIPGAVALVAALTQAGVGIHAIVPAQASLEQVFSELTRREQEAQAPAAEAEGDA